MGEEGEVLLRVLVNESGSPGQVEIKRSSGVVRLDAAAQEAAIQALFKPYREDGRPVAVYAIIPINFAIQ